MYHTLIPAVHMFFVKHDSILLLKRLNTGYHDGDYSVPAGHIEPNESVIAAAIREAFEELGILVRPAGLTIVQVMHRKSSRERVDFFLRVNLWQGDIRNHEPDKCEALQWFPVQELPENTIPYIRRAIQNYVQRISFDVFGWEGVGSNDTSDHAMREGVLGMTDENLGNSIMFMVDALVTVEEDYGEIETGLLDAALRIVQIAWNAEVRGEAVILPSASVLSMEPVEDTVWEHLIRDTSQELVNMMRKRKQIFFPDDTRRIRRCFGNVLGTISVEEDNEDGTLHVGQ
jgi:8-oxo-dGTP pyrophosphatase MutT (NUDIX family)